MERRPVQRRLSFNCERQYSYDVQERSGSITFSGFGFQLSSKPLDLLDESFERLDDQSGPVSLVRLLDQDGRLIHDLQCGVDRFKPARQAVLPAPPPPFSNDQTVRVFHPIPPVRRLGRPSFNRKQRRALPSVPTSKSSFLSRVTYTPVRIIISRTHTHISCD